MTTPTTEPQPVVGAAREPALVAGAVAAVVTALCAFGIVHWTEEQRNSAVELGSLALVVLAPIVQAVWTRARVTPTKTVAAQVDQRGITRSGPADTVRADGAPVVVEPAPSEAAADVSADAPDDVDHVAPTTTTDRMENPRA